MPSMNITYMSTLVVATLLYIMWLGVLVQGGISLKKYTFICMP